MANSSATCIRVDDKRPAQKGNTSGHLREGVRSSPGCSPYRYTCSGSEDFIHPGVVIRNAWWCLSVERQRSTVPAIVRPIGLVRDPSPVGGYKSQKHLSGRRAPGHTAAVTSIRSSRGATGSPKAGIKNLVCR